MKAEKPNPSAAADKPLSKKLEQIREAIFVWDNHQEKWLDKLNDAINEAKKLEAQQTDAQATAQNHESEYVTITCGHTVKHELQYDGAAGEGYSIGEAKWCNVCHVWGTVTAVSLDGDVDSR